MQRYFIILICIFALHWCSTQDHSKKPLLTSWNIKNESLPDIQRNNLNAKTSTETQKKQNIQKFWDPILVATFVKNIWWYPVYGEDYTEGNTPPPYDIYEFEWLWLRLESSMIQHWDTSLPFLSGWNIIFTKNGSGMYSLGRDGLWEWFMIFDKPKEQKIQDALRDIIQKEWKNPDDCAINKYENSGSIFLSYSPKKEYKPSKKEVLNDLQKSLYRWMSLEEIEKTIKDSPEYGLTEGWLKSENSNETCGIFSQKFIYKVGGVFVYNPEVTKEHFIFFNSGNGGWGRGELDWNLYFFTK